MAWPTLFLLLLAVGALVAAHDWRRALPWVIVAGVVQDPVRKLMPDTPAYMVLGFLPVWAVVVVQVFREDPGLWSRLRQAHPRLVQALAWFLLALVPAAIVLLQYGPAAPRLAALGALGYVSPVLAMLVGYAFARRSVDVRRLLVFYCVFMTVALAGGLAEYLQLFPESRALGTSALGTMWVRTIMHGHWVALMSGFFRSPDLMGWHAAALIILALTLAADGRSSARWAWGLVATWGGLLVLLSGRSKMILMPAVWIAVMMLAALRAGRARSMVRLAVSAGLLLAVGLGVASYLSVEADYVLNAQKASEGAVGRLHREAITSVEETFRQSGFWGEGLGIASQGRQHLGVDVRGGWQESGPSKLLVELGVPGFLAGLFLAWATALAVRRSAVPSNVDPRDAILQVCIFAFLAANLACFTISHQAFSDGTIVIMNGVLLGVGLSGRRWASRGGAAEASEPARTGAYGDPVRA